MRMTFRQRLLASSLLFGAAVFSAPAYAQDNEDQDASPLPEASEASSADTIVVTGSRIRRDEFNSPTPIQVLEAEEARRIGITNVQDLLQRTTVASGTQIDATLNTASGTSNGTEAPPSGGTGSSNIDLRGLGIERSLVLINGRRLGSAGVRGAPAQPDISLLPLGMIERIDVVTEGASSIYGADAVAGVVNVILRTDFEGLEITGGIQRPEHDGGDIETVSLIAGASSDRARIMLGVDYYRRQIVTAGQRRFSNASRRLFVGEDGQRYVAVQNGLFDNFILDNSGSLSTAPNYGAVFPALFYTPGTTNIGVDNFSDYRALPPLPAGIFDQCTRNPLQGRCYANFVNFDQYNEQDELRASPLVQPLQRYSFVATGSYDLFPEHNVQAYIEAYYFNRQQRFTGLQEQIFPDVPGVIPVVDDQGFALRDGAGNVVTTDNPFNPFNADVTPIISVTDIPQTFTVEVQQTRLVGGIRGDVPGRWFEDRNWSFDVYWSYDRATGFQSQPILLEEHLFNATQGVYAMDDGAGGFTYGCGPIDRIASGGLLSLPDCVPVNLFAPSIYATGGGGDDGSFATQAERDYLIGNRTNRTVVQQTVYSATVTGDLFTLPWANGGMVAFAAGFEHRDDSINSQNDIVGVQGLNAAENPSQEGETIGRRSLNEVYAELSLPLLSRVPFAYELTIDGAVRYTEESNFGDDLTYRARALWRPVNWMQFSGSYGTSYRAPNLREQFLAPQAGGIGGGADPCINVNVQAAIASSSDADPAVVNRINNCIASGVVFTDADSNGRPDTTVLGTLGVTTIPVFNGGNANLEPETSRSYTATFAMSPPIFGSAMQLNLSASYYDIRVESSVNELDAATIINRCYLDEAFPNLSSPFCSQISRPTDGTDASRIINSVRSGFVNTGFESIKGIDLNVRARINLEELAGLPRARLTLAGTVSYVLEHDFQVLPDQEIQDLRGTFGYPNWKFQPNATLAIGPWTLVAQGRFIGPQHRLVRTTFSTPASPNFIFAGSPIVRAVDYVGAIYYQDLSLTYDADRYSITAGITNLFDREPNLIDGSLAFQRNNAFTGSGYDFIGRTFFINGTLRF